MWKILIFLLASPCSGQVTVNGVPGQTIAPFSTTVNGQTCTIGSTCTIPLSAVNPQTATYQVLAADFSNYKTITVASGTFTITLVASGSQPAVGQYINVVNYGSGVVTVARSGQNINGGTSSLSLPAGSATAPTSTTVWSDGTNYFANLSGVSSGGSSAFSGLLAATGTNTIDNTNYAQTWNWSTATSQNLLSMNFNALTSGSALSLLTSNASLASTNGFLNVANTGAATGTSIFARLQPNSTSGSGLTVLNNSNVGIGTTAPSENLFVNGNAYIGKTHNGTYPYLAQLTDNPLSSVATTVDVTSTTNYPTSGTIKIDTEYISCTGVTSTSFTGCTRGAYGSTASSHLQNAVIGSMLLGVGPDNAHGRFFINSGANLYNTNDIQVGINKVPSAILDVYDSGATAGDTLFNVGSSNSATQFAVKDQQPVSFGLGLSAGSLQIGQSGYYQTIYSNASIINQVTLYDGSGNANVKSGSDITFFPGYSTQQVTFKASGNVGIGTTSPGAKIDVSGNASAIVARFWDQTASTGVTKVTVQDGAGQSTTPSFRVTNNAGTAFSMTARGAIGTGIILTDSAGACWNIVPSVSTGVLTSTSVTCPTVP
jgi:hypothetical protein